MNINEMSDQEKSVVLARLMGWSIEPNDYGTKIWIKCPDSPHSTTNLYEPVFMFLAWRVLNWAYYSADEERTLHDSFMRWWDIWSGRTLVSCWPEEAQRLWLDKILELAIGAGMVNDEP